MNNLVVGSCPHITQKSNTTRNIMLDVIIALCPAIVAAVYFFGYHVLINIAVCVLFAGAGELVYGLVWKGKWNKEQIKRSTIFDLSCVVTAIILALNLPSVMDVWGYNIVSKGKILFSFDAVIICAVGSLFAIVIVKMLFGGIGSNFANPAAAGRVFLFIAIPSAFAVVQSAGIGLKASTGATWLASAPTSETLGANTLLAMLIGNQGTAAVGETCAIAILLGYAYLSIRKVIDWRIPLVIMASTAVFALLFDSLLVEKLEGVDIFTNALGHVLSGGLIFGAVFMATDYSTSPNTFLGNVIFGIGISLFTVAIRVFAGFPEGVSFAIILCNLLVPLIDKYIYPKPFGSKGVAK